MDIALAYGRVYAIPPIHRHFILITHTHKKRFLGAKQRAHNQPRKATTSKSMRRKRAKCKFAITTVTPKTSKWNRKINENKYCERKLYTKRKYIIKTK